MSADPSVTAEELSSIVADHALRDRAGLRARLEAFAARATPAQLERLATPYREDPDVMAPLYERVVAVAPDARSMVVLANAYWLQGRGPEVVGELASRAITFDSANRGAWHLWALSESDPRLRTQRWSQVVERFPEDLMALAALADNAASVAGAERDHEMLDLAIESYERLSDRSTEPAQRYAVDDALRALRGWRL
jgi:hypothetical protein